MKSKKNEFKENLKNQKEIKKRDKKNKIIK